MFTITHERLDHIDLRQYKFSAWPSEARRIAYGLLMYQSIREHFKYQLFRHDWLAAKVEAAQALYNDCSMEDL